MEHIGRGALKIGELAVKGMTVIGTRANEDIEETLLSAALSKKLLGTTILVAGATCVFFGVPVAKAKDRLLVNLIGMATVFSGCCALVIGHDMFRLGSNLAKFASSEKKKAACFLRSEGGHYIRSSEHNEEMRMDHRRWIYWTGGTYFLQHIVHYYFQKEKPEGMTFEIPRDRPEPPPPAPPSADPAPPTESQWGQLISAVKLLVPTAGGGEGAPPPRS